MGPRHQRLATVFAAAALALSSGCHGGTISARMDSMVADALSDSSAFPTGSNVVPVTVDEGERVGLVDVGYVSVTLCAPGTQNCQTLDHVALDTGSIGLRVLSTVLTPALFSALPHLQATSGDSVSECYEYADGFVYGSVLTADVTIGSEAITNMTILSIGDLATTPAACAKLGTNEHTIDSFGYSAIMGIAPFTADCGEPCTNGQSINPQYYDCTSGGTCAPTNLPIAMQVQNPAALVANDNTGVVLQLPAIDDTTGTTGVMGTLTFGVGTQDNNVITTQQVYIATNEGLATLSSVVNGQAFPQTIFDSGTTTIAVDLGLPACSESIGFLCPATTQMLTAALTDANNATGSVAFDIANADALFNTHPTSVAFDDIAASNRAGSLILGLPFFFGKKIFFAIDGANTPSGVGPYYAL